MSQRALARAWINGRTENPYTHRHVQIVCQVASLIATSPRPRFRDAYNEVANDKKVLSKLSSSSEREIAGQWINVCTGQPYSQMHVSYVLRTFQKHAFEDPRLRWLKVASLLASDPR